MGHGFAPVAPVVDYDPESLVEFFGTGHFPGDKKKPSKDLEVILLSFPNAGDWFLGITRAWVGACGATPLMAMQTVSS